MKLLDPNLTLTYTSDNTTETTRSIESDSVEMTFQLYGSELSPSSNTVSLNLIPGSTSARIISEVEDIKAVLKDGSTILYTGYLGNEYNWTIGLTGEQVLNLTLEGVGTHLLDKTLVDEDDTCIHDTALNIIDSIITRCGSVFLLNTPTAEVQALLAKTLTNTVSSSDTCSEILEAICFELGLVYSFDANGHLSITKTDISASPSRVLWADNSEHTTDGSLWCHSDTAIALTRSASQYKQVKVAYDRLKDSATIVPVYRVTETVQVPAGEWWDGSTHSEDIYDLTLDEWFESGKTYYTHDESGYHEATVVVGDPVPENTYYEYAGQCSTVELTDIDNGKDIVYVYPDSVVPNATARTTAYPGYVETSTGFSSSKWTLKPHGNTAKLDVLIDNTLSPTSVFYTKFKADARIITKQASCSIYRAAQDLTANSEAQYDYEATWIHEQSDAVALADLLNSYWLYANNTYVFYTDEDLTLGTVVSVKDNVHSGLDIDIFLTAKACVGSHCEDGVWKYTGQAVSDFSLKQRTRTENTSTPVVVPVDGEDAKMFSLSTSSYNYDKNQRTSGNQTITISTQVSGYTGTPALTAIAYTGETGTALTITDNQISFAYNNAYDKIVITATLAEAPTQTITLLPNAKTATSVFLGVRSTLPTETEQGELLIAGDYFVVGSTDISSTYTKGSSWAYNGTGWTQLTDANKLLTCLNGLVAAGTDLSLLGNPNTVSWFSTIIAEKGIFNQLFSQNINVLAQGYIQSNGVVLDSEQQYPTNTGFKLGADGILHSNKAYITGLNAVNGSFSGDFESTALIAKQAKSTTTYSFTDSGQLYGDISTTLTSIETAITTLGMGYGTMTTCPSTPAITDIRYLDSSTYLVDEDVYGTVPSGSVSWTSTVPATVNVDVKIPYTSGIRDYVYIYKNGTLESSWIQTSSSAQSTRLTIIPGDILQIDWRISSGLPTGVGYVRVNTTSSGSGFKANGTWLTKSEYIAELTSYTGHSGVAPITGTSYAFNYTASGTTTSQSISIPSTWRAFDYSQFGATGVYNLLATDGSETGSLTFHFKDYSGTDIVNLSGIAVATQLRISNTGAEILQGGTVLYTIPNELYETYSVDCKTQRDSEVKSKTLAPLSSVESLGIASNPWAAAYIGGVEYDSDSFKITSYGDDRVILLPNGVKIEVMKNRAVNTGSTFSFNYPEAYTGEVWTVQGTMVLTDKSAAYARAWFVSDLTTTGFSFWTRDTGFNKTIDFLVIGKDS